MDIQQDWCFARSATAWNDCPQAGACNSVPTLCPHKKMKPLIKLWNSVGTGLIVEWPSGILVSNQTGGTVCLHPQIEGIFVPFGNDYLIEGRSFSSMEIALDAYFTGPKHEGTGATLGLDLEDYATINQLLKDWHLFDWFEVNEVRLKSSHEAWVHVRIKQDNDLASGFGPYPRPGILTWSNSD